MDRDDFSLTSHRCRFDIDIDEELKSLKKSRPSCLDAENVDSLLNSSRWDVTSVKLRSGERERPKSRELESRTTISCLKREIDEYKEQNAKLQDLVREQRQKLEKTSEDFRGVDLQKERTNVTVTALQKEVRATQDRLVDLEERNRTLVDEREKLETRVAKAERQLREFALQISEAAGLVAPKADDYGGLVEGVRVWCRELAIARGQQVATANEAARLQAEVNQHRGTIESLLKETSGKNYFQEKHDSLAREFEKQQLLKNELEKEVEHLKAKLDTAQSTISALNKQLESQSAAQARLESDKRSEATNARNYETQYNALKQSLAAMLSEPLQTCGAREDEIKDRIRELQQIKREKSETCSSAEERLKDLQKKFAEQYEQQHAAEKKAREAEKEVTKLQEKLLACERELSAGDVFRDSLKDDRQRCQKAILRIARALKLDQDSVELEDVHSLSESVVRRVLKLLERRDRDYDRDRDRDRDRDLSPSDSESRSWKRRFEKASEQLHAKEAHMELLRKKLAQLEERSFTVSLHGAEETDSASRKLEKRLKNAEEQLVDARRENGRLKAELLECQNVRIQVYEQDKDIQALERTLEKLEKVRQKQSVKIVRLKSAVDGAKRDTDADERSSAEDKVRSLKAALEETKRYERALREFRTVVGRLVGLNMASSTVTDAEILSRLERLLRSAQQPSGLSLYPSDLSADFRNGYKAVDTSLSQSKHRQRSRSPSPKDRVRSGSLSRLRSGSPVKVDNRKY